MNLIKIYKLIKQITCTENAVYVVSNLKLSFNWNLKKIIIKGFIYYPLVDSRKPGTIINYDKVLQIWFLSGQNINSTPMFDAPNLIINK